MLHLTYFSMKALCLGLGAATNSCSIPFTSTSLAHSGTGPPSSLHRLSRKAGDNLRVSRPYFDPSFSDLSTPQERTHKVKRLAHNSDVFHLKGFLTEWECQAIMHEAKYNYKTGMTKALSNSEDPRDRTNCKVAWLGDSRIGGICGMIGNAVEDTFVTNEARMSMNPMRSDLQVLNYQEGGGFVLHHDSHDRIVTVITFLNGVGETWLPLVDVDGGNNGIFPKHSYEQDQNLESLEEATDMVSDYGLKPGASGILLSGNVRDDNHSDRVRDKQCFRKGRLGSNNQHVVYMDPGDAVAFYSYGANGKKDFQSIHAGIPLDFKGKEGKWIATSWFHAPSLIIA
mmetsp:Transcript_31366/g.47419  ORF Transcript_31366/g.47419 Transcript_31366/m.47419 type:complete len:341 (+) Transcript_31366:121-1143(+)